MSITDKLLILHGDGIPRRWTIDEVKQMSRLGILQPDERSWFSSGCQ